jgi:antitoxin component YwqK of YwqJK toxin-antitoxin module
MYYSNNNKAVEGHFADKKLTKRNGTFTYYYNNTPTLKAIVNYDYNVANGVWQQWYDNGQKKDSGRYYYNKLVARWKYWHRNGVLETNSKYADSFATPKGVTSGLSKEEKPTAIAFYINNYFADYIKVGMWQTYYDNNNLKDSTLYIEGLEEGLVKQWYANGNVESKGFFTNGKRQGEWSFYYENGNVATIENYTDGVIKTLKCFDTLGKYQNEYCGIMKPAMYPGGPYLFEKYVKENAFCPESLSSNGLPVLVQCKFLVNAAGKVASIVIDNSPNVFFDKAITNMLNKMPNWEPAISHNRKTDYVVELDVVFNLTKQ